MTANELKKLSRVDLLEMLLDQSKRVEELEEKLREAEEALFSKEIKIENAGSIAEASLQLSGIFEAAQLACQQYTDNLQNLSARQEAVCAQREAESRAEAERLVSEAAAQSERLVSDARAESERLLSEAKAQSEQIVSEAQKASEEMVTKAKAESQSYWIGVSEKLESFYREHSGLRELLSALPDYRK